jgi:hypothetical protein
MSLRHCPFFNGAQMAQWGLRHCHRRPKGKPMAHWLRLWFFPKGAPMAQRRPAGGKIPTRWHTQTAPKARRAPAGAQAVTAHGVAGTRTERAVGFAAVKISGMYKPGTDIGVPKLGAETAFEMKWSAAGFGATAFTSEWGEQAQAFGWTVPELFGLHPVPEQPAANYSRLSRMDSTGLVSLLRGRPVVALTATEAAMRCPSGAASVYRRQNKPTAKAAEIAKVGNEVT